MDAVGGKGIVQNNELLGKLAVRDVALVNSGARGDDVEVQVDLDGSLDGHAALSSHLSLGHGHGLGSGDELRGGLSSTTSEAALGGRAGEDTSGREDGGGEGELNHDGGCVGSCG